jgi:hypothetical protein
MTRPAVPPHLWAEVLGADLSPVNTAPGGVAWPHVPAALGPALFGQPQAGQEWGTYAVIDAGRVPLLQERLAASDAVWCSLFAGESAETLADVAPYLVQLAPDGMITRRLFRSDLGHLSLWDAAPAIFLRSPADIDTLRHHLRRFNRVQDADGTWLYLRMAEADCLYHIAAHLPPDQAAWLLPPPLVPAAIVHGRGVWTHFGVVPDAAIPPARRIVISPPVMAALSVMAVEQFLYLHRRALVATGRMTADLFDATVVAFEAEGLADRRAVAEALAWTADLGRNPMADPAAPAELAASRGLPDAVRLDRLRNLLDAWGEDGP